jgi:argonaute-like protein implicated in RNA metabolism and viral defense
MNMVFEYYDIRSFPLRFGGGGIGLSAYEITRYGPLAYQPLHAVAHLYSVNRFKSLLILYKGGDDEIQKLVNEKLKKHLLEGLENKRIFPGFNSVFKLNIEISTVPFKSYDPDEIFSAFQEHCSDIDACFPLIVLPRVARGDYDSIYYRIKAIFLNKGVTSQVFTVDLLKDEQNYKWSLLPTAIQIFTKMGGVPYALDRGVLGEKVSEDVAVFIMGLGISYHPLLRRRGVGYLVVFDQSGAWYFMDSTALLLDKDEDLSKNVTRLLVRSINNILSYSNKRDNVLIIHYSGKEIGRAEEEAIANAIKSAEKELNKFLAVYILKIRDSDIIVYDTQSVYMIDKAQSGYPPIGLTLQLKPDIYLMFTSGYFFGTHTGVKVNIRRGLSRARIISRHKEMELAKDELKLGDKELLATVFGMCRLNYSSVQNPVAREPITVRYSREIAWLSLRLSELGTNLDEDIRIKKVMWFI